MDEPSKSSVSISGPLTSTLADGSSTSVRVTSALAFGNVMSTSGLDTLKSISGPLTFGIEIPRFGILNLPPFPVPSMPVLLRSMEGPSISTMGAVISTFASGMLSSPSNVISFSTSGISTEIFGEAAPNLGNLNEGILNLDGEPLPSFNFRSISDPLTSTLGEVSSTSGRATSYLDSGNVRSTSGFDKLKSTSGPFTFGIERPRLGILILLPFPIPSVPVLFRSMEGPSTSTLGAVMSTVALGMFSSASNLICLSTSGISAVMLEEPVPNLGSLNLGILNVDEPSKSSGSISGTLTSTLADGSSTSGRVTSALAFGSIMSTSVLDTPKSISAPLTFGIEIPKFGILNLLPFPVLSRSMEGPSISTLGAVISTLASGMFNSPCDIISFFPSGISTDIFVEVA